MEELVKDLKQMRADMLSMHEKYGICTNGRFGKVVCNDCPLYYGNELDCHYSICVWGLVNMIDVLINKQEEGGWKLDE